MSAPVSNPRRPPALRARKKWAALLYILTCVVCCVVYTHTLTPPIQLSVNQVILTRLMYKCSGFKKIFSLLLLLLLYLFHPLLLFRGPCEFLRFFLVSTASGHTPKRERRGNGGVVIIRKSSAYTWP